MRLRWCFIYFDDGDLVQHPAQTVYDSVRNIGMNDAEFLFDQEVRGRFACFWKFDDFSGVIVPSNICEIYSIETGTERQPLNPIIMQIAFPEYVATPQNFDAELYQFVKRHCIKIPINEMVEESAKKIRAPHVNVPKTYEIIQGGEEGYGNRCRLDIKLYVENKVALVGLEKGHRVEFRETMISLKRIMIYGIRPISVENIHDSVEQTREEIMTITGNQQQESMDVPSPPMDDIMDVSDTDEDVIRKNKDIQCDIDNANTIINNLVKDMYILAGVKIKLDSIDREALHSDRRGWEQRFLTDNIVHLLFGMMKPLKIFDAEHYDVYVMSSFFMKQLMLDIPPTTVTSAVATNYVDRLLQWAVRDDGSFILFNKDVIIIPYNYRNIHWLLYVVYKPYAWECKMPLLYIFDSSSSLVPERVHRANFTGIITYFKEAYKHHKKARECPFVGEHRGYCKALVTQQDNGWACGWYMFLFGQQLFVSKENRDKILTDASDGISVMTIITPPYVDMYREKVSEKIFTRSPVSPN